MSRSPAWQQHDEEYDYSDFAQEFLRRNPAYRRAFAEAAGRGSGTLRPLAGGRAAQSWGLEFPRRSPAFREGTACDLAGRRQSQHCDHGRRWSRKVPTCRRDGRRGGARGARNALRPPSGANLRRPPPSPPPVTIGRLYQLCDSLRCRCGDPACCDRSVPLDNGQLPGSQRGRVQAITLSAASSQAVARAAGLLR